MRRTSFVTLLVIACIASVPQVARGVDAEHIRRLEQQMADMQKELQALRAAQQQEQAEQERRQNVLAEEFENLRTSLTVPELKPLSVDDRAYGFGPAASKVYGIERGFSIGGYGEAFYRKDVGDKTQSDRDTADFLRFVLYTGYKFSERIIFNAEIEFEHATTGSTESAGGGSVSVEFAYLDFLMWKWANFRAGMLLIPMGITNELHEPVFFHGVERPEVERRIIPTTWRENGIGIFGEVTEGVTYKLYAVNGFNAKGFRDDGFRGGRQKANRTLAEDIAFVGRFDYSPMPSLSLGASVYTGDSGQNQVIDTVELPHANTTIWEVDGIYRSRGLELRGLFAMSHLGDAAELTEALRAIGELSSSRTLAQRMLGGYLELAYDIMPYLSPGTEQTLLPFVRFSYVDLQNKMPAGDTFSRNGNRRYRIWTPGLTYRPHPNIVLKVDYRNFNPIKGQRASEANFGLGFVF